MVENMVSDPYACLWSTMVDRIFPTLAADAFTFIPGIPIPLQKVKQCNQYKIFVAFYRTL